MTGNLTKQEFQRRNADVYFMRADGMTLQEIGENISTLRERVRQILAKINRRVEAAARFRVQRDAIAREFGVPWDELLTTYKKVKSRERPSRS